jgi:hypothetical protein
MDRKAKYIIAGLVLLIILMIILFFMVLIGGIATYFVFLAPTGNVGLVTESTEIIPSNELNEGWNSVEPENESNACIEDWECTEWTECIDGKQTRTCTDNEECGSTENKPIESQDCEIELIEIENMRIDSVNYWCTAPAPSGFSSGGMGIKSFEIENTGHDLIEVNGLIKVSFTLNDVTDSTIEFNESFSLEKNETYEINLIKAHNAGWDRAYLYLTKKIGTMTVRIDLPDNKFIEVTKSISGLC